MTHYGTLRDFEFGEAVDDIRGAVLYGPNDEKLGEIDDVIFDHTSGTIRYVVIDTGGWLRSQKFLVPADRIEPYHRDKNDFYTDLDKERIKLFPPFDEKKMEKEEDWNRYEEEFKKHWVDSPVVHRADSPNIVTPTSEEMPPTGGIGRSSAGLEPRRIADRFAPAGGPTASMRPDDATSLSNAVEPTATEGRFNAFQSALQNERKKIVSECDTCGVRKDRVA